ncbi:hypothetical protein GW17_00044553 [Ensete ventricosum]|uniref:Uncharacterized protein n=1 Tax=Ensete ventricosum TaxID=4639 RepID=A0A444D4H0_ENSVE|nr:hypothetical protein GW17_00044553 [Ensete ventricosum]RZR74513.1 hypothetical protein BHM03_00037788 [Ensete ventricosum]
MLSHLDHRWPSCLHATPPYMAIWPKGGCPYRRPLFLQAPPLQATGPVGGPAMNSHPYRCLVFRRLPLHVACLLVAALHVGNLHAGTAFDAMCARYLPVGIFSHNKNA